MRLATAQLADGSTRVICRTGAGDFAVDPAVAPDMLAALTLDRARLEAAVLAEPARVARLLAPLRPRTIVCIGLNYLDHVRETRMVLPDRPLVFAKFASSVIGPDQEIQVPRDVTDRVDWEVELAAVIGRPLRRATPADAVACVFGYTAANDLSARDIQFGDGQWVRGKSLDTFGPLGPELVTADEIGDVQTLGLRTRVNGETVQDSSTAEMIFGVAELLSFCSHSFSLGPGDVVLTGTPWGVGEFMDPVRSLHDGDVVEVEIDRIGTLRNPVVDLVLP